LANSATIVSTLIPVISSAITVITTVCIFTLARGANIRSALINIGETGDSDITGVLINTVNLFLPVISRNHLVDDALVVSEITDRAVSWVIESLCFGLE
jgi:hypothetical protein